MGELFQSESFGAFVLRNGTTDTPKFGFVISNKVSKDAVQRNMIKRAFSEGVRHSLYLLKEGIEVVFLAKSSVARKSTEEIMREVKKFLSENLFK